jgi:hypothetical protein
MIKNKEKQFDCIKMKNGIQAQIYAETQNMSKEELLSYFNKNGKYRPRLGGAGVPDTTAR